MLLLHSSFLPLLVVYLLSLCSLSWAYNCNSILTTKPNYQQSIKLFATRLEENIDGVLYVNDKCINCAACSNFAPTIFERNEDIYKHVVYNQPNINNKEELEAARSALQACPVNAIRVEQNKNVVEDEDQKALRKSLSSNNHDTKAFPKPIHPMFDTGVYYTGHHNDSTFGAIPYLILGKSPEGNDISVMVDVPRFSSSAVNAVKLLAVSGPDYLFLTHVDDTADQNKWKKEFPNMKRIFHSGDLGKHNWVGDLTLEEVEILLQNDVNDILDDNDIATWDINGNPSDKLKQQKQLDPGEFLILHTPGHSPGSISLLFRPEITNEQNDYPNGILFTGDTYAWTVRGGGYMSGFPRYGNNLPLQATTLQKLCNIRDMWDIVCPGHGHLRFYDHIKENRNEVKQNEMIIAIKELQSTR